MNIYNELYELSHSGEQFDYMRLVVLESMVYELKENTEIERHPILTTFKHSVAENGQTELVDIRENEKCKEQIFSQYVARVKRAESPMELMRLFKPSYYLYFLTQIYEEISKNELGKLLSFAWRNTDSPNASIATPALFHRNMFLRAAKQTLMTNDERQILASLPEQLTVYRGVGSCSQPYGFSFTTDYNQACTYALRDSINGDAYVYTGNIEKTKVLAYFIINDTEDIVIDPNDIKNLRKSAL